MVVHAPTACSRKYFRSKTAPCVSSNDWCHNGVYITCNREPVWFQVFVPCAFFKSALLLIPAAGIRPEKKKSMSVENMDVCLLPSLQMLLKSPPLPRKCRSSRFLPALTLCPSHFAPPSINNLKVYWSQCNFAAYHFSRRLPEYLVIFELETRSWQGAESAFCLLWSNHFWGILLIGYRKISAGLSLT